MKSPAWLRQFARKLISQPVRTYRHTSTKVNLRLDEIEERVVPATVTWINAAGGSWNTGTNWSTGSVPTASDDVVIPDLGTAGVTLTVTISSSVQATSVTTAENLTLNANQALTVTGNIAVNGGATIAIGGSAALEFNATVGSSNHQITTNSTGTVAMTGGFLRQTGTSHSVSFNTGVTVRGYGTIGHLAGGASTGGNWNTAGTWSADVSGQTLSLNDFSSYHTLAGGVWETKTGATLQINPSTGWTNQGKISVAGGTINLGGTFTPADAGFVAGVMDPNRFARTGGTVNGHRDDHQHGQHRARRYDRAVDAERGRHHRWRHRHHDRGEHPAVLQHRRPRGAAR